MRHRWLVGLLAIAGSIATGAPSPRAAAGPPSRRKVTCQEFRTDVETTTKAVGFPMTIKAGDWAKTPPALRVLPPKAALCGSSDTSVFIASPLFGKELEAYYRPILEKLGCAPLTCEIDSKKTTFKCDSKAGLAMVRTEVLNEAYAIGWLPSGH